MLEVHLYCNAKKILALFDNDSNGFIIIFKILS
jgi:hypothetical protein